MSFSSFLEDAAMIDMLLVILILGSSPGDAAMSNGCLVRSALGHSVKMLFV